jgi:DNA-binding HxlR family transcriptional regulator
MNANRAVTTASNCDVTKCISPAVLVLLANKWGSLVVRALSGGAQRYSEIRRAIEGSSEKMLAQTLRGLQGDGLVLRTRFPVVPPHVVDAFVPVAHEQVAFMPQRVEHVDGVRNCRAIGWVHTSPAPLGFSARSTTWTTARIARYVYWDAQMSASGPIQLAPFHWRNTL